MASVNAQYQGAIGVNRLQGLCQYLRLCIYGFCNESVTCTEVGCTWVRGLPGHAEEMERPPFEPAPVVKGGLGCCTLGFATTW